MNGAIDPGRFPAVTKTVLVGLRLHDLCRHTAVALWIAAGRHAKEIAQWAGHTKAGFVLDRYGHVLPTSADKLRESLDAMIAGASIPAGEAALTPKSS